MKMSTPASTPATAVTTKAEPRLTEMEERLADEEVHPFLRFNLFVEHPGHQRSRGWAIGLPFPRGAQVASNEDMLTRGLFGNVCCRLIDGKGAVRLTDSGQFLATAVERHHLQNLCPGVDKLAVHLPNRIGMGEGQLWCERARDHVATLLQLNDIPAVA